MSVAQETGGVMNQPQEFGAEHLESAEMVAFVGGDAIPGIPVTPIGFFGIHR